MHKMWPKNLFSMLCFPTIPKVYLQITKKIKYIFQYSSPKIKIFPLLKEQNYVNFTNQAINRIYQLIVQAFTINNYNIILSFLNITNKIQYYIHKLQDPNFLNIVMLQDYIQQAYVNMYPLYYTIQSIILSHSNNSILTFRTQQCRKIIYNVRLYTLSLRKYVPFILYYIIYYIISFQQQYPNYLIIVMLQDYIQQAYVNLYPLYYTINPIILSHSNNSSHLDTGAKVIKVLFLVINYHFFKFVIYRTQIQYIQSIFPTCKIFI
eukprot:TRINITY_DN919_c0_g1_i10.p2 TRINITY_DN919_c0_g1~~TRINITY_DN919_c0_g1_i10.p2  ORF type:complete len:264 (+),score=-34.11 TRINITY_DN919_c0_g1_i10:358-1149(+)